MDFAEQYKQPELAVIFLRLALPWAQYACRDMHCVCNHRAAHWPSSYSLVVSRSHSLQLQAAS